MRILGGIVSTLFLAGGAGAAPPANSSDPGTDRTTDAGRQSKIEEIHSIGVDRQLSSFAGTVLDVHDRPLASVQVKLFIDGHLVGTALTDGTGYYDLRSVYDPTDDATVLLWFVAPERSLMAKELVIRESRASQANGLISKCVPRATHTPGRQFRVYLFDAANRNKELSESECLP